MIDGAAAGRHRGRPGARAELEPYLGRDDIDVRRFGPDDVELRDGDDRARRRRRRATSSSSFPFTQRHHAQNALAALHAYDALGLPLDRAAEGVAGIAALALARRGARAPGGGFVVNDAYNANPTRCGPRSSISPSARGGRRRVAILGEMAELGDDAERLPPRDRQRSRPSSGSR